MSDIAPELLEQVRRTFQTKRANDKTLGTLYWAIQDGRADYETVNRYAIRLGELLTESIRLKISASDLPDGRFYQELAEELIDPLLTDNYELISTAAVTAQNTMNRAAGIGLNAVKPTINQDRVQGLVDKVSSYDTYEEAAWVLAEPVVNFSQSVVNDAIRENVDAQARAGLHPTVKRIAESGCCEWCANLAGEYAYPVDREVYRRHNYCRCIVLFDPGNGKVQNVHTKIEYDSAAKAERDSRIARMQELEQKRRELEHRALQSRKIAGKRVNGVLISGMGDHVFDRMDQRGISIQEIMRAIDNPLRIGQITTDQKGRRSFKVIGESTTVYINPDTGLVTTVHKTHAKLAGKLKGGK
jgi:hypothetical protein